MASIVPLTKGEQDYLHQELAERRMRVYRYLASERYKMRMRPDYIYEGSHVYLERMGKAFRPAYLMWCCGATGGSERERLSLIPAAAVETFHTWGLVHDDIIDQDDLRRGGLTVHRLFEERAWQELNYDRNDATRFGQAVAILAGDSLMGWTIALLTEMFDVEEVDPGVTRFLIEEISCRQIPALIDGETMDLVYEQFNIDSITENDLLEMSRKKTGSIFEFAGMAGAMIGINRYEPEYPFVRALMEFAKGSGTAFQLVDDVINIVGETGETGKAVGSDIVAGKRTIPIIHALKHTKGTENLHLRRMLGNAEANPEDVEEAIHIIKRSGAIDYTKDTAFDLISKAFTQLDILPESEYKTLIALLGRRLVDRKI